MFINIYKEFRFFSEQLKDIILKALKDDTKKVEYNVVNAFNSIFQLVHLFDDLDKEDIYEFKTFKKGENNNRIKVPSNNYCISFVDEKDNIYLFFKMYITKKKTYYNQIYIYDILYRFLCNPILINEHNSSSSNHIYLFYKLDIENKENVKLSIYDFFHSYENKKITKFII